MFQLLGCGSIDGLSLLPLVLSLLCKNSINPLQGYFVKDDIAGVTQFIMKLLSYTQDIVIHLIINKKEYDTTILFLTNQPY